jgi:hypothetical protein
VVTGGNENVQFIIVTNSSALIDKATAEELFMLMPSEQLAEGSNQLVDWNVWASLSISSNDNERNNTSTMTD